MFLKCFLWAGVIIQFLSLPCPVLAAAEDLPARSMFEQRERSAMIAHMRQQVVNLLPTKAVMGSLRQANRKFIAIAQFLGLADAQRSTATPSMFDDALTAFAGLWRPTALGERREAFWLTPGYNHVSGLMPWKDSVTLGFNYERLVQQDRLHFRIKPYIGQGLARRGTIWGAEANLAFGQQGAEGMPLATIGVRYDDGDATLADGKRGFDVNGAWMIHRNLDFTVGAHVRENDTHSGYALLRWHWTLGED